MNKVGGDDNDSAETGDGKQTGSFPGDGKNSQREILCGKDLSKTQSLDLTQLCHFFFYYQPSPGSLPLDSRFFMTSLLVFLPLFS